MKLPQKIIFAALVASMTMTVTGCVGETHENETETHNVSETEPHENETEDTSAAETEDLYLDVPKPSAKEIEALPKEPEEAIMTACAIGGNPVFYIFDEGLTYYVHNLYYETVTEYTLELPEGYINGKIVMATSGAGSGEIFLYVSADNGGVNEYLDYFFLCTHPVTFQYAGKTSEYDISRIEAVRAMTAETEESEITQPENLITVVDTLPHTPEEARLTVSAMGGNPVFYVFEDNMTCYVHNLFDDTVTEYSFGLPDGYTDGKIVLAARGAGSGEVHLYVTAEKGGEYEYLDYYFYCGESPIRLSVGKVNEYNIPIIEEEIAALECPPCNLPQNML